MKNYLLLSFLLLTSTICLAAFDDFNEESKAKLSLEQVNSKDYQAGYKQGELTGGVYGEMFGILSGVIYGHAIYNLDGTFCLKGSPKEKVKSIAQTLWRLAESETPSEYLGDIPTKASSLRFLRENFSCE
ncbi:MAG: hypothetical protein ACI936_003532 [Paraglaciecola sp.]